MIKIENLNKYYNKGKKNQIHVIDETTLELPDKGLVALLGPSGCGKTTLLNAIGGLDRVNKGSIYIDGTKITRKCARKIDKVRNLKIGYIFQDYKLIDSMTVFDNVAMVLKMLGIKDKEEIRKRVQYILERVDMYRYRYRPCGMLSGGERQRVGIARALVKNPDIILADEPTGNLDSKNTIEIMNIIKAISQDKLVILVTHEVDLAKFYATKIIEVLDGKVVKNYNNKNAGDLDYRIDNKFYLKDFKYHNRNHDNDINIEMYSDTKEKLNLTIIFKNGNVYIKNKDNDKIEVIDNSSNIELVNDNYKKLDKSVYEKYSFDYEKMINKDIKLRYSSIFNIFSFVSVGFKKVFGYSFVKKLLLIGFFLSSIFVTYSISNILGIIDIADSEFISTNKNYMMIDANKINVKDYLAYEKLDGINYILPGDSQIGMYVKQDFYYQTATGSTTLKGSLSSLKMINKDNIIYGRMPENEKEIVIDKMVFDRVKGLRSIGLFSVQKMLDVDVYLIKDTLEYKIVGIVDLVSPSIYVDESQMINILTNNISSNNTMGWKEVSTNSNSSKLYDYSLYSNRIKISKGRAPTNDYEVIVNSSLSYTFEINKYIDDLKVNNTKLKVVGYYTSMDDLNSYFVSSNTVKINLIDTSKNIIIYPSDKELVAKEINELGKNAKDVYEFDRESYINSRAESLKASMIVAIIMLAISLVEIVLMMRSSFLSRIKEVGIYRAIGVKKSDIYKMFTGESIAITTLASLPGALFMSYCINAIKDISYVNTNYVMNIYVVILCVLVVFAFNIIVGLIPAFNTIRKTPAAILARHDLD